MPYGFEYCDLLICLVNEPNSHWMVIIADFTKKVKTVTLYDSLGEKQKKKTKKSPRDTIRDAYLDAFCNYMDDEIRKNKGGGPPVESQWKKVIFTPQRYAQTDSFSCGIYVLMYVESFLNGVNPKKVNQKWLHLFRSYLLVTIVSNKTMYLR